MEQDIPDYDMDSDDERWLHSQTQKLDLSPLKFEEMMDRLEKSSGQTVVTLNEAKALLKDDDDLIIAVYDYWLNKRLKTVKSFSVLKISFICIFDIFLATSVDFDCEDGTQNGNSGQQPLFGLPPSHRKNANTQDPKKRRSFI